VRSSATAEDLPDASFAGQQDTFLWITGADAVVDHVRRCWSSLYTARSIAYRHDHGFADHPALMGVGVQQMVEARVAGVALTMNPINGDRSKIVIDASFGLGEAVVSGHVTPDNFVVDKVLLEVLAQTISAKHVELVPDVDGRRVVERAVEPDRQSTPSLASQEVKAIAALAKQVERHYGCPQDVEWALDHDGSVFLLQSRPETIWTRSGAAPAHAASYETGMAGLLNTLLNPLAAKESADVDDR
jgi:pyruvate, water dikinase